MTQARLDSFSLLLNRAAGQNSARSDLGAQRKKNEQQVASTSWIAAGASQNAK